MASFAEEIQGLNGVGLDFIDQGDLNEAASAFSYCLSELSWCVLSPTPLPDRVDSCEKKCYGPSLVHVPSEGFITWQQRILVYSVEGCNHTYPNELRFDAKSEFFPYPFYFESPGAVPGAKPSLDCSYSTPSSWSAIKGSSSPAELTSSHHLVITICCLYNLALCHHLEWKKRRNKANTRLLETALSYYEQAFAAGKSKCGSSSVLSFKPTDAVLKVLKAVCVNATHCHCELGNVGHIGKWNRALNAIMRFSNVGDNYDGVNESSTVRAFFILNAFLNSIPRSVSPAA
ncbi:hypothetical protein ACA910_001953 [Epithemia clementina (nom. ined.)]